MLSKGDVSMEKYIYEDIAELKTPVGYFFVTDGNINIPFSLLMTTVLRDTRLRVNTEGFFLQLTKRNRGRRQETLVHVYKFPRLFFHMLLFFGAQTTKFF